MPLAEIKDYNIIYDRWTRLFLLTGKNNLRTYDNIQKIKTVQGDDYTAGCVLDYAYFKNYYQMIAIDLNKQPAVDANPKAIQLINVTANLDQDANAAMFFVIDKARETIFDFSQGTVKAF